MFADYTGEALSAAAIGTAIYKAAPYIAIAAVGAVNYYKAHTKNASKKNWDKHTKKRSGAPSKASKKPGWVDRSNKKKP